MKFYTMWNFNKRYAITSSGIIKNMKTDKILPRYIDGSRLYVLIDKSMYYIDQLVWNFFIGELIGKIKYKDDNIFNLNAYNLYTDCEIITVSQKEIYINGIEFLQIPGMSKYYISRNGTVYTTTKNTFVNRNTNDKDYYTVTLVDDNNFRSPRKVHRLVYMTYIGSLDSKDIVNHKDGNRQNPNVTNLDVMTQRGNVQRGVVAGSEFEEYKIPIEIIAGNYNLFIDNKVSIDDIIEKLNLPKNKNASYSQVEYIRNILQKNISYKNFPEDFYRIEKMNTLTKSGQKITLEDANNMRRLHQNGASLQEISDKYFITKTLVCDIVNNKKWTS